MCYLDWMIKKKTMKLIDQYNFIKTNQLGQFLNVDWSAGLT